MVSIMAEHTNTPGIQYMFIPYYMVYSLIKITEIKVNFQRTSKSLNICKWDKKTKLKASFNDVLSSFRYEMALNQNKFYKIRDFAKNLIIFAFD